jgi:hypothetical protein
MKYRRFNLIRSISTSFQFIFVSKRNLFDLSTNKYLDIVNIHGKASKKMQKKPLLSFLHFNANKLLQH